MRNASTCDRPQRPFTHLDINKETHICATLPKGHKFDYACQWAE